MYCNHGPVIHYLFFSACSQSANVASVVRGPTHGRVVPAVVPSLFIARINKHASVLRTCSGPVLCCFYDGGVFMYRRLYGTQAIVLAVVLHSTASTIWDPGVYFFTVLNTEKVVLGRACLQWFRTLCS